MWRCLFVFRVTKPAPHSFAGLYTNDETKEYRVVRMTAVSCAASYKGYDTGVFFHVEAKRPKKVFRTIYLTEGDPTFNISAVNVRKEEKCPDLGVDDLRRELTKKSE